MHDLINKLDEYQHNLTLYLRSKGHAYFEVVALTQKDFLTVATAAVLFHDAHVPLNPSLDSSRGVLAPKSSDASLLHHRSFQHNPSH